MWLLAPDPCFAISWRTFSCIDDAHGLVEVALRRPRARSRSMISVLAGSSLATSCLVRRSMNGLRRRVRQACGAPCHRASRSACGRCGGSVVSSPSKPGREELEQRPQLAEIVLERRACQRTGGGARSMPVSEPGAGALRVLDRLRLVEDGDVELLREQHVVVAHRAADRWSARGRGGRSSPNAACGRGHAGRARRAAGAKRAASACQFGSTLVGQPRSGPGGRAGLAPSRARKASACTVLPRPMSSARTPPNPASRRKSSQARPWPGRAAAPP